MISAWRVLCSILWPVAVLLAAASAAVGRGFPQEPPAGGLLESSLVDFSFLLDPPAGKHGFLSVDAAGRFVWPNGRRARFWGVNISNRSVFVDRSLVDRVVPVLARAGVNIVRFEALDSAGGLLHDASGRPVPAPDEHKLAILDYWTWRLREKGIYYYFDLLDLRTFRAEEGVLDADRLARGARPASLFDPVLIDLQKKYATALLLHRNPHTGLRYADDPALALVEICNESGFFLHAGGLSHLPERYAQLLSARWNAWLRERYGSRDQLAQAWGTGGQHGLRADEDAGSGTVRLLFGQIGPVAPASVPPPAATRQADVVRFLTDLQQAYLGGMKAFLRSIGLRVPITGVLSNQYIADGASTLPLDFTAGNYYCDHPTFDGGEWQGSFLFNNINPLRETGLTRCGPTLAMLRWGRKPLVIREWAQPWPNEFRSVAVPEVVAYGSLHDVDGFILFGYEVAADPQRLGDFDHQADTPVWGLMGLAALSFLREDIRPSPASVTLIHDPARPPTPTGSHGDALTAGWHVRVRNVSSDWPDKATWRPVCPASMTGGEVLERLRRSGLPAGTRENGRLVASTGQIVRNLAKGVLMVTSPRTVVVAGELGGSTWHAGPFTVTTASPVAAFWAVSLDGEPLARSQRFLLKMVTTACNSAQRVVPAPPGSPARFRLEAAGTAPVDTRGRPRRNGVVVHVGNRPVVTLHLEGGAWEVCSEGEHARLLCDTSGIRGEVYGTPVVTSAGNATVVVRKAGGRSVSKTAGGER